MPLVAVDETAGSVACYAPPAYLLGDELYANGGTVDLFLSANGRDVSANSFEFLYRPVPVIESVLPVWLLAAFSRSVSIYGQFFFVPGEHALAILTPVSEPTRARSYAVTYESVTELRITWPAYVFEPGE
jgi:hypothetical protein